MKRTFSLASIRMGALSVLSACLFSTIAMADVGTQKKAAAVIPAPVKVSTQTGAPAGNVPVTAAPVKGAPVGAKVVHSKGPGCAGGNCGYGCSYQANSYGCNNCSGAGCANCGQACCEPRGGFYAAIGFYYVQPHWESNPAATFTASRQTTGAVSTSSMTSSQRDFDYDYDMAPRIIVGFENADGFGGRIGWYKFDQSAGLLFNVAGPAAGTIGSNTVAFPTGASTLSLGPNQNAALDITSDVVVDVWDFDVTQRIIDNELWDVLAGGGIRYAHLSQDYSAFFQTDGSVFGQGITITQGGAAGQLHASNTFNGAGPNVFLEGRRRVGNSGNLALYSNLRAGVLFGTGRQTQFSRVTNTANTIINTAQNTATRDDVLPFLDAEIGVEWQGQGNGTVRPFVRTGIVGQNWFGAGNGSSSGTSNFENLGFFGLNVLVGGDF